MKIISVRKPNYVAATKINEISHKRHACKRENFGGNAIFSLHKKMRKTHPHCVLFAVRWLANECPL